MAVGKPPVLPIFKEEAVRNGLTLEQLLTKTKRTHFYVRIRQYAMWRARNETGRSYPEIARVVGMDHTTVIHGCAVIESLPPEQRGVVKRPRVRRSQKPTETYVGKPCLHGHGGLRYVANGVCVECNGIRRRRRYHAEKLKAAE